MALFGSPPCCPSSPPFLSIEQIQRTWKFPVLGGSRGRCPDHTANFLSTVPRCLTLSRSNSCSPWFARRLKEHVVGDLWIGTDVQRRRILDPRSANRGYLRAIVLLAWSAASRFQVPLDLFCGLSPPQGDGRRSLLVILTAISLLALFSWEPQPVSTW